MYPLISRIIAANLTHATERVAIRLLTRTGDQGHLSLSWDDYCKLCNRKSHNSARRHLTALVKAKLIRYHAGAESYITLSWPAVVEASGWAEPLDLEAADGAPTHFERSAHALQADPQRAAECGLPHTVAGAQAPPAVSPRTSEGAVARRFSHTRAVGGGGTRSSVLERDYNTTTNHSEPINERLRQIGLRPKTVKIEDSLSDDEIQRIIDDWLRDSGDDLVGVGALFYRLANGITPPDLDHLEEEVRRNKYIPEEYRDIIIG